MLMFSRAVGWAYTSGTRDTNRDTSAVYHGRAIAYGKRCHKARRSETKVKLEQLLKPNTTHDLI